MGRSLITSSLVASIALCAACGEDGEDATIDRSLSVEIVQVSTETLDPGDDGADDVTLTVAYRDGDGNLGGGVAEVHDCRAAGLVTNLPIPELASEQGVTAAVPIFGELSLTVENVGPVGVDAQPPALCEQAGAPTPVAAEVVFCVQLVDAQGDRSDPDCTQALSLTP